MSTIKKNKIKHNSYKIKDQMVENMVMRTIIFKASIETGGSIHQGNER